MKPELKHKILEDLAKSGFGSEMNAIRKFIQAGWTVSPAPGYFDPDDGILRPIDFSACNSIMIFENDKVLISFEYHIHVEVKKTERPWIAFTRPLEDDPFIYSEGWTNPFFSTKNVELTKLADYLTQTSLPLVTRNIGYSVHEAFKNPDQPSRWYPAFIAACKASTDLVSRECFRPIYTDLLNYPFIAISNPAVLLDGQLITADIDDSGCLHIEDAEMVPFRYDFGTASFGRKTYRLDLVTISALDKYIALMSTRVETLFKAFCAIAGIEREN